MTNATSNILKMSQQKQIHIYYKLPDSYSNPGLISKLYTIKGEKKKSFKNTEEREQSEYYKQWPSKPLYLGTCPSQAGQVWEALQYVLEGMRTSFTPIMQEGNAAFSDSVHCQYGRLGCMEMMPPPSAWICLNFTLLASNKNF